METTKNRYIELENKYNNYKPKRVPSVEKSREQRYLRSSPAEPRYSRNFQEGRYSELETNNNNAAVFVWLPI